MSAKSRKNLRRETRRLSEAAGGALWLRRITAPGEARGFLESARSVGRNSWQRRALGERVRDDGTACRSFENLASRGILRAYFLQLGDRSCTFVIGYQYAGVYHYIETGFDEALGEYSPGTVLLFLMLEDLHVHERPEVLNFGVGDATYKQRFGNSERADVSCFVMRRRLRNIVLTKSHAVFSGAAQAAKRLLRRQTVR